MKKRRVLSAIMGMALAVTMVFTSTVTVLADSAKVVTIGADLTKTQKDQMFEMFGVKETEVIVIEVTNEEEKECLSGVLTAQEIGTRTLSCSYICPTAEGSGIRVKLYNINRITSTMIASTLTTAGIYNCDVIAACPIEVSGTGALTGIMKAFEQVTGEELDEEKKDLATQELIATTEVSSEVEEELLIELQDENASVALTEEQKQEAKEEAQNVAAGIITEVKAEVIANNITDTTEITNIVNNVCNRYDVNISETQVTNIVNIVQGISNQGYDMEQLATTYQTITDNTAAALDIDVSETVSGILDDSLASLNDAKEEATGFFGAIGNFFKGIGTAIANFFKGIGDWVTGLFGGGDDSESADAQEETQENEVLDEAPEDSGIFDNIDSSVLGDDVISSSTIEEIDTSEEAEDATSTEDTTEEDATTETEPTE